MNYLSYFYGRAGQKPQMFLTVLSSLGNVCPKRGRLSKERRMPYANEQRCDILDKNLSVVLSIETGTNIKAVDMRCRNCTTELWGNPTVCPVCGTPTGQKRRPRPPINTPPPPPLAQQSPSRTPSGLFNAADLLDPEVLADLPNAEPSPRRSSGGLFSPAAPVRQVEEPSDWLNSAPPPRAQPAPEPDQTARSSGMLNAADLFDPDVLAGFSFPGAAPEAPAQQPEPPGIFNAADLFDPEVLAGLSFPGAERAAPEPNPLSFQPEQEYPRSKSSPLEGQGTRQPSTAFGPPPAAPRTSRGMVAPPHFSLTPIAPEPPEAYAPPERPSNARLPRVSTPSMNGAAETATPVPLADVPRGWRIVSDTPPTPVRKRSRHPSHSQAIAEQLAAAQGIPAPAQPASKSQRSRPALAGLISLLVALAVLTIAALFGLYRYQQIMSLQPTPIQNTSGTLPTVAPKAGYVIFPDTALAFSLQYPTQWQRQPDHDGHDAQYRGDLFSSGVYAALEVGSSPKYSSWSPGQINDYILNSTFFLSHVVGVQLSAPASPTIHIAGQDWTAEDADVTFDTGVVIHMTSLAIIHQGRGYAIFYYAVQEQFSFYSDSYYEPMLLSFRFLG
jgi:hypothetical protein